MDKPTNLVSLQKYLKEHDISALLIPHEDRFLAEYTSPEDERLAWVSGFTGSAGFAIVTQKYAGLFTDGRYTIQAAKEAKDFICQSTSWLSVSEFIQHHDIHELFVDPWLISSANADIWQKYTDLQFIDINPVDAIWQDRFLVKNLTEQNSQVLMLDEKSVGKTRYDKLGVVRNVIKKLDVDGFFLHSPESVNWLLNIRGNDVPYTPILQCMAIVFRDSVSLFCDPKKISIEHQQALEIDVLDESSLISFLQTKKQRIAADVKNLPMVFARNGIYFHDFKDPCLLPKAKKTPQEIKTMQKGHIKDAISLVEFMYKLQDNENRTFNTECEAQDALEKIREQQADYVMASFPTISAFAEHGAIVHYRANATSDKKLGNGVYLLDSGAHYHGATTDVTRTFWLGNQLPSCNIKRDYTQVLKGHIALAKVHFPKGLAGSHLDALARQFLWEGGENYSHGTGHGVGCFLNVHEGPQGISPRSHVPLELGMIISNEPGIYHADKYGIRIENLQIVEESVHQGFYHFKALTLIPYEEKLIDFSMLTRQEIQWLKLYYKRIKQEILPFVNHEVKDYLINKLNYILDT